MTRRCRFRARGALCLGLALSAGWVLSEEPRGATTHLSPEEGKGPLVYAGPGREIPDPLDLDEVRLGYFGPPDGEDPEAGDFWLGASLAIEDVNAEGGYRGLPFRLLPAWSRSPWGSGIAKLTELVFDKGVLALIASVDGASAHLAEQVAAKAFVTVVSPGSTDPTVNMANVPWMFSLLPSDASQAPVIGAALSRRRSDFVLVSGTDHDSRVASETLGNWLRERRLQSRLHLEWNGEGEGLAAIASAVQEARPTAVVVLAAACPSALLVRTLRARGFGGTIVGGATLGRAGFASGAGKDAEGVLLPMLYEPGPRWDAFLSRYVERFGRRADYASGEAYDAVRLVAAAVRAGGLNRARISDAVRELAPWHGVTGQTRWNDAGQAQRAIVLATIKDGGLRVASPED